MNQVPPPRPTGTPPGDPFAAQRLLKPTGPIDVVFDSDTYNEIDDQYALAYMLRSTEKLRVQALYAAPFTWAPRADTPRDGMEKSYQEMKHVLSLIDRRDLFPLLHRGAEHFLQSETEPAVSDAARDLARRAMAYTPDAPLYVIAIGAITNIASAILLNPDIADRIVVVWLGGNGLDWTDNHEFNLSQDIAAARVVFGSGAALVMLPCGGVVSEFAVSRQELIRRLQGKNALCDYLLQETLACLERQSDPPACAKVLWDVTAVAWLLDGAFTEDRLEHAPIPGYDRQWRFDPTRHMVRYVYKINREHLLDDLFRKLAEE